MGLGDFNGDMVVDVAVTNTGLNTVSVSLGNGDGTFSAPRQFSVGAFRTPNPVGDHANLLTYRRDILAEDFNHDGILDLVVTNFDSADVSVLLGRGDGTFEPQKLQELPKILFLAVVALGDFDKDGNLDLVAGGGINEGLDIFRGIGDGSFVYTERVSGNRQAASLAVVDLDGDGNLDVIATSLSDNNAVTIVYGTGDLKFKAPQDITDVGQGPLSIRVFDWGSQITLPDDSVVLGPRDGKPDLIVANSGVIPYLRSSGRQCRDSSHRTAAGHIQSQHRRCTTVGTRWLGVLRKQTDGSAFFDCRNPWFQWSNTAAIVSIRHCRNFAGFNRCRPFKIHRGTADRGRHDDWSFRRSGSHVSGQSNHHATSDKICSQSRVRTRINS